MLVWLGACGWVYIMCNLCFHYSIHGFQIGFVAHIRVRAELWSLCMKCYRETTWRALLFFWCCDTHLESYFQCKPSACHDHGSLQYVQKYIRVFVYVVTRFWRSQYIKQWVELQILPLMCMTENQSSFWLIWYILRNSTSLPLGLNIAIIIILIDCIISKIKPVSSWAIWHGTLVCYRHFFSQWI